jgi:hypothetical protein
MAKTPAKKGPKPDRVKIDEDWEEAVKKALKKKRPKGGWPDHNREQKPKKEK